MCGKKHTDKNRKNFLKNEIHNLTKCADTLDTFLPNKLIT